MASIATCFTLPLKPRPRLISKASLFPYRPHTFPLIQTPIFPAKVRESRVSVTVVRASLDAATGIRPGGAVESDKLPSDVRKRTMDAVDASGGRVTIGDVSSRAGLKLNEAQNALQALAADTEGFLEVSDEGDVLYVFPKDYRAKLLSKSFRMKIEPVLEKAKAGAEYVARVSFGTALIASIVLVYTAIIVALSSSRSEDDNRGRRGRSYDSGFTFYMSPGDLFWFWDPYYYRRRRVQTEDNKMKFVESIFSFVFGDGDPNQGIEEERWKLIGQYITSNGGVVAAEELAPYLDLETSGRTMDDETYILPVLLRYEGQPVIDEEWANSLCQGANLPLDMPLKVDKIAGGTRLGFIVIGDGETEVLAYIDCLVFPPDGGSGPIFRAVRNGRLKDQALPGEPRIMRSLMQALQKSVQIARV